MKARAVSYGPRAESDLISLYDWIAESSDRTTARQYIQRIEDFCLGLAVASERGTVRDDIRPGLRTIGFERRVTIDFQVTDSEVLILRVLYGGRSLLHLIDD